MPRINLVMFPGIYFNGPSPPRGTQQQPTPRGRRPPHYPRGGGVLVYGSRRNGSSLTGLKDGPHIGGLGLGPGG